VNFENTEEKFDHQDTLCYVFDGERILMIDKKRGLRPETLGEDEKFLNGPGGKIEKNETPHECAIRETVEETGIRPEKLVKVGEMAYYRDGNSERFIHIFRASDYSGSIHEGSEEAEPLWLDVAELDYGKMWPSDGYWMPELVERNRFRTRVVYEKGEFLPGKSRLETGIRFSK
jgi:8-oxo-dGTP diphosphatase